MVLPTGSGKSLVMADLIKDACQYPDVRVLVLAHVKELLEQNAKEIAKHWPNVDFGIYSAGLRARDLHNQVIVAGIQSIHKKGFDIGKIDLCLIDEAHLISRNSNSMYGKFLANLRMANPALRVIGLTATPYRLDSGTLIQGKDSFFHGISHETNIRELIDVGHLCWITSKRTHQQFDVAGVATVGGEFKPGELELAVDIESVTREAVKEIVSAGKDRRAWLIFGSGVMHTVHIRDELRGHGIIAEAVTGETTMADRSRMVADFSAGKIKALVNCQVFTTGFNVPFVDLIALMRPTKSTGLYVQMVGRGTRNAPGKSNCVILDFAQNIERHGPIDCINVGNNGRGGGKREGEKDADIPVKVCPRCEAYVMIALRECPECHHGFPAPEVKVQKKPDEKNEVLAEQLPPEWVEVRETEYKRHEKAGKQPSLKVDYWTGMTTQSEWICFEHGGYAAQRAALWWYRMGGLAPAPGTVQNAQARLDELRQPSEVQVRREGKFTRICGYRFHEIQDKAVGDDDFSDVPF